MKKFFRFLVSNGYDIFVGVFLLINLGVILFTEGHTEIMAAVTFWGLLIAWKIDNVLDRQKIQNSQTHIYIQGGGTTDELEATIRRAVRDANL